MFVIEQFCELKVINWKWLKPFEYLSFKIVKNDLINLVYSIARKKVELNKIVNLIKYSWSELFNYPNSIIKFEETIWNCGHLPIFIYWFWKLKQLNKKNGNFVNLVTPFCDNQKSSIGFNINAVFEKVQWFEFEKLNNLNRSPIWLDLIQKMLNWNWSSV